MTKFAEYMDAIVESGKGNIITLEIRELAHEAKGDVIGFAAKLASLIWTEYVIPVMQ